MNEIPKLNKNSPLQEKAPSFVVSKPIPEESAEEYIYRVRGEFVKFCFPDQETPSYDNWLLCEANFSLNKEISVNLFKNLEFIKSNNKKQSVEKDFAVLDKIDEYLGASVGIRDVNKKDDIYELSKFFKDTIRSRSFFTKKIPDDYRKIVVHGYSFMMFGLPEKMSKTPEASKYLHSLLDKKNIYFLGGGDSGNDLIYDKEYKPNMVVNIDPYIIEENLDKNNKSGGIYRSVPVSVASPELIKVISEEKLPKADEIWASYSVPYYLNSSKEISDLIKNISLLLAENGNAHIYPISVSETEDRGENFFSRKEALISAVKDLMATGEFNITMVNRGLHIHKLKKD